MHVQDRISLGVPIGFKLVILLCPGMTGMCLHTWLWRVTLKTIILVQHTTGLQYRTCGGAASGGAVLGVCPFVSVRVWPGLLVLPLSGDCSALWPCSESECEGQRDKTNLGCSKGCPGVILKGVHLKGERSHGPVLRGVW